MTLRNFCGLTCFWRSFSLQTTLKTFWHIFSSRYGYVKCSPTSDVFSAREFVTIRQIKSNLKAQHNGKWKQWKSPLWGCSKWCSEIFENSHFLAKFLTSNGPKKISTHFLVSAFWIMVIQRTNPFLFGKVLTPPSNAGFGSRFFICFTDLTHKQLANIVRC